MTRSLSLYLLYGLVCFTNHFAGGHSDQREGFFNKTSYVNLPQPIILNKHIGLSFRSCTGGELFTQKGKLYAITLEVRVEGLFFKAEIASNKYEAQMRANLLDNEWHTVNIRYQMSNLTMSTSGHKKVIANSTYNSEVLNQFELYNEKDVLIVGSKFEGCILEGPNIVFSYGHVHSQNVEWGSCPLPTTPCRVVDHCANEPCMMHGRCITLPDRYFCHCAPRYSGNNCQIDSGPMCNKIPCKNGGVCHDDKGDYVCYCPAGFAGKDCDVKLNTHVCDNNSPCQNNGTCIPISGELGYQCLCESGFEGRDCEININECLSNPCLHGGTCQDGINSFLCLCSRTGYTGSRCEININECENNPCLNNGICFDNYGGYTCQCTSGFGGQNCEQKLSGCASSPCNANSICVDTSPTTFECSCKPGFTGIYPNCTKIDICSHNPCSNGGTCQVTADGGVACICLSGYSGPHCEINVDECLSLPCQNGGTCFDGINGYLCNCTEDFMGDNCELKYNACAQKPCQNNGTCVPRNDFKDYLCDCAPGFNGVNCEHNIDECATAAWCGEDKICVDGINSYECKCKNGKAGPDCQTSVLHCSTNPCQNGATCIDELNTYSCICPGGFTGKDCDIDINECEVNKTICNYGICINSKGSYECFCRPGYSGSHCEVDFDECLSHPCKNGAKCANLINKYECTCTPGFTGTDCGIDIDECESDPCLNGSSCINEIATFSCVCPPGLTGRYCETNIDDCDPNPCLFGGKCIDGLNSYTCNCENTGYEGEHCEHNIDECASDPCQNGANCTDLVNSYHCQCHLGYEGVNCENDINECASNPCKYNGTCYQKSEPSYYLSDPDQSIDPENMIIFNRTFSFSEAAGYECKCIEGITGVNCEININECESSPCEHGTCQDGIASFTCECDAGYEGPYCRTEIDECVRYTPCVFGVCHDKVADYFCECDSKYGGKNCSVELTGCNENQCQNNGTCKPYLDDNNVHRFNCSCTNGFQGPVCEKVTTMSLNGSSYAMVNTTREEGYDIQFRFKTTLSNGLLAIGKGSTFYILELTEGRLNLHSSLLNKWEGVFIGSNLNDSKWQKVFVAINSSHLVLAANEEQTIYPINLNEGSNASHTSFPTTYLGGTISYLRRLTHGPSFYVGCVQDVMINGHWVIPQDSGTQPISFVGVEVGCKREPQCSPNPCHSGGHCADLWRNFSCSCERPYLGRTCQYNFTAATFGHENITESVVHVVVDQAARRAVRSIMDISMFIRTREPVGGIFYLGSKPNSTVYNDETVIAAKMIGGELRVSFQFNGNVESYGVDGVRLDNGFNHLIQVVRNVTLVQVKINGTEYFRKTISATGQLDLQYLMLGGLFSNASDARNFKGVIQDVKMTNGSRVMVVEFFPLTAADLNIPPTLGQVFFNNSLVLEGVVSDNSCRDDPCMHGGTCTVTWNDFSCACTVGHKGKQCEEMEFCQVQDCPAGSECRNLDHGYECVANITIHKPDMMHPGLYYKFVRGEQNTVLNEISFAYRSKSGGKILQVGPDQNGNRFIVTVYKDQLTVSWQINGLQDVKKISKDQRDGDWTNVWLKMHDSTITGGLFGASEDTPQYFTANFSQVAWEAFVSTANITIGGVRTLGSDIDDRHSYSTVDGDQTNSVDIIHDQNAFDKQIYEGCIGEVRFGNLLLPYFTPQELNSSNISTKDHFELLPGSGIGEELGCLLCFDQECNHGGKCTNSTLFYTCTCPPGYDGDACENDIDECKENDCKNNSTCKDGQATYTCDCMPGWQGPLCDIEIDECSSNPCQNGGTCIDRLGYFECSCPDEFIGSMCEQLRLVTCDSIPCKHNAICHDIINPSTNDNFTCVCKEGFVGIYCEEAFCEKEPCENSGECHENEIKPFCECQPGFTGKRCEVDIDECSSNPCEHNGKCKNLIASFECDCSGTGFSGDTCAIDIDECEDKNICPLNSNCLNTMGSHLCKCFDQFCGLNCTISNPCLQDLCSNGGTCVPNCIDKPDYYCECVEPYSGKNCTEVSTFGSGQIADIAIIVVPILAILILAGLISLSIFFMMARKKRATRGTYSPSSQEYCNPRVELDNVMKPPPEERLI